MKRKIILLGMLGVSAIAFSQVGINNSDPKATLDVTSKTTDGSRPEGIIAPRLTGDQIKLADLQYTSAQAGTLIYATSAVTAASTKTANITTAGYYYFNGSVWQKIDGTNDEWINDPSNATPMIKLGKKSDGLTARDNYTDFVATDNGRVGIGTSSPSSQLEVKSQATNATIATFGNVNGSVSQQLLMGVSAPASNNGAYITTAGTAGSVQGVANSLRLGVNGGEAIRIDASTNSSSGNVGIGTGNVTVNFPLQVHRVGTSTNVYTQHTNGQTGITSTDGLIIGVEGTTGRAIINNQESSTMSIYNNGAERITVLGNGVVGIGTTSPSLATLHVNSGTAKGSFRLTDTTEGLGKVLTSDANGNASWATNVSVAPTVIGTSGTGVSYFIKYF